MSKETTAGNNVGDVALGYKPNIRRQDVINAGGLKMNVFPGEVVNKADKSANYQFAWVQFDDQDYYQDLKDEGYKPVIRDEWEVNRWDWFTPEKDKFRWNTGSHLVYRDYFLMYRNQDLWALQQANQQNFIEKRIDGIYSNSVEDGLRHGLSFESEIAGKPVNVEAPKKRHSVS